jgi:hypothetical protein
MNRKIKLLTILTPIITLSTFLSISSLTSCNKKESLANQVYLQYQTKTYDGSKWNIETSMTSYNVSLITRIYSYDKQTFYPNYSNNPWGTADNPQNGDSYYKYTIYYLQYPTYNWQSSTDNTPAETSLMCYSYQFTNMTQGES